MPHTRYRKRTKYGAQPTVLDGFRFASKAEARRYCELRLLSASGQISDLVVHPRFTITVNGVKICTYTADFQYRDHDSLRVIVEDVKSDPTVTREFKLKKKLMKAVLGIEVSVHKG